MTLAKTHKICYTLQDSTMISKASVDTVNIDQLQSSGASKLWKL